MTLCSTLYAITTPKSSRNAQTRPIALHSLGMHKHDQESIFSILNARP